MSSNQPIFIGGMYKSGTSLLRAMLGRHSRLFAGLETQWLNETWHGSVTVARRNWLERLSVFFDTPLAELESTCGEAKDVETCLDHMLAFFTNRAGKARWIEKTPGNVGAIERILKRWPQARILHIIRDPRDVYASMIESHKWTEPEEFAGRWGRSVGAARNWLAVQGGMHPAYYELRYERLVREPEQEVRKVLGFLDEPFEEEVAKFSGQPEDFDRVRKATGKESPTLRRLAEPMMATRVGVWSKVVVPEAWAVVHAELVREGYGNLADQLIDETDPIRAGEVEEGRKEDKARVERV
ncbi:MAG TPA: sulfotransferase [Phycisphaerae bacterium]|nr:sulfotransferase [Phycisphaerae bacterium]HUU94686.1 sulfotransferase [Phycisphaerae bacterium]